MTAAAHETIAAHKPPAAVSAHTENSRGLLCVSRPHLKATTATRVSFAYPLRLFVPKLPQDPNTEAACTAFISTYGGGLVSGDCVALDVDVRENAKLTVASLAEGKVYRRRGKRERDEGTDVVPARMDVVCDVAPGASLLWVPEPTSLFQDSALASSLRVSLADDSASCMLVDCVTAGRTERERGTLGEGWAAASLDTRVDVSVGGKLVLSDHVRASAPHLRPRLGGAGARTACLLVFLGTPFSEIASHAEAEARRLSQDSFQSLAPGSRAVFASSSRFHGGRGVCIRAASTDVASLRSFVRHCLLPLVKVHGHGVLDLWP